MKRSASHSLRAGAMLAFALGLVGCASGGHDATGGSGGSAATGGAGGGTGGVTATGGTSGTGGSTGGSGGSGTGGSGGSGTGGSAAQPDGGTGSSDGPGVPDGPAGADGSTGGGGGGAMMLTSPTVMMGGKFPPANTAPMHHSPELSWSNPPAAAKSFAVTLTDTNNNLIHWVVWDIPTSATKLPADLDRMAAMLADPMGAQQKNFQGTPGYFGPNPGGTYHLYRFEVWALDAAALPMAAGKSTSQLLAIIKMHAIAGTTGSLSAMGKTGGG
jgi:Raf kinase inhibitor-like YbhB/YbcL family protein